MLQDVACHNLVDARGRLLPRSYDVLGDVQVFFSTLTPPPILSFFIFLNFLIMMLTRHFFFFQAYILHLFSRSLILILPLHL